MLKLVQILGLLWVLWGCNTKKPTQNNELSHQTYPLVVQKAQGQKVQLSDMTQVEFSYDFAVAQTEVTQADFKRIMGYMPLIRESLRGDSLPVVNVSALEAMLFCNALSKNAGLDTVYTYASLTLEQGRPQSVSDLSRDLTVAGFRLPTEAEWVYVAEQTTASLDYGWVAENSQGVLHLPCSSEKKAKVCDMLGNAMEMVEGWYETLPQGTYIDYVGALLPNDLEQRVVKGGSYLQSLAAAAWHNRTDVYNANLLSAQEYIGFRVARGAIAAPVFGYGGDTTTLQDGHVKIKADKNQVRDFFGTSHIRIALINSPLKTIYTMDYSNPSQTWTSRPVDGITAKHPSISPDGRYLAFSNRAEGQNGDSQIWTYAFAPELNEPRLLGTGAIPRWWEANGDTLLLYANTAASNQDSSLWSQGQTFTRAISEGWEQSDPLLISAGAYHSGMDSAQQWLVTASTQLRVKNLVTQKVSTLFQAPLNGKDTSGSTQVCNASISPGANPRIAFLDFGYTKNSSLVGRPYGVHEFIFILDPATGEVTDTIAAPADAVAWGDPEWSNHPDFIIATATNKDGYRKDLYAINVRTHEKLHLAQSFDLETPVLWVRPIDEEIGLFSDSLGQYAYPYDIYVLSFADQIWRFWIQAKLIDGIIMGSSRCYNTMRPLKMSAGTFQNLCVPAAFLPAITRILPYVYNHAPQINTMVLNLDLDMMFYDDYGNWGRHFGKSIGYLYDSIHDFWPDGVPKGFIEEVIYRKSPAIHPSSTIWGDAVVNGVYAVEYEPSPDAKFSNPNLELNLQMLESIITQCQAREIRLLGLMTPQNNVNRTFYGRHGLVIADAKKIHIKLQALQAKYPRVFKILDLHQNGDHNLPTEWFYDMDHMNAQGADWVTARVDSVLQEGW